MGKEERRTRAETREGHQIIGCMSGMSGWPFEGQMFCPCQGTEALAMIEWEDVTGQNRAVETTLDRKQKRRSCKKNASLT